MLLYFLVFNKAALIFASSSNDNQITKKTMHQEEWFHVRVKCLYSYQMSKHVSEKTEICVSPCHHFCTMTNWHECS